MFVVATVLCTPPLTHSLMHPVHALVTYHHSLLPSDLFLVYLYLKMLGLLSQEHVLTTTCVHSCVFSLIHLLSDTPTFTHPPTQIKSNAQPSHKQINHNPNSLNNLAVSSSARLHFPSNPASDIILLH